MAVKIRLVRTGRTNRPAYRIGVFDARTRRDGAAIEVIGHYDPVNEKAGTAVKADRARHWLARGAQPSGTVQSILKRAGVEMPAASGRARARRKRRSAKRKAAG